MIHFLNSLLADSDARFVESRNYRCNTRVSSSLQTAQTILNECIDTSHLYVLYRINV